MVIFIKIYHILIESLLIIADIHRKYAGLSNFGAQNIKGKNITVFFVKVNSTPKGIHFLYIITCGDALNGLYFVFKKLWC